MGSLLEPLIRYVTVEDVISFAVFSVGSEAKPGGTEKRRYESERDSIAHPSYRLMLCESL